MPLGRLSDLEVQGDYAGHGSAQRDGRFASEGFAKHLDATRSRAAVDYIDLRERSVRELFVFPKDGGRGHKQSDVKAIVAALAVEDGDQLIESGGSAGAAECEAARSAVERIAVSNEDAQGGAARDLVGDSDGRFFNTGRATIRMQEDADAQGFAGSSFAFFQPGAVDGEGLPAGNTFDVESDSLDLRNLEGVYK